MPSLSGQALDDESAHRVLVCQPEQMGKQLIQIIKATLEPGQATGNIVLWLGCHSVNTCPG
jgi:hypothetical protein